MDDLTRLARYDCRRSGGNHAQIGIGWVCNSPDSISASYVSDITYRPLSCNDLAVESAARLKGELEAIQRVSLQKKCVSA
jgi:hypothetical protein